MAEPRDPFRPTDDEARALARQLLASARFAALGVLLEGMPHVTRIALARGEDGSPMTLISELSPHTAALRATPEASLLVGEPAEKGDPLSHPRLTLSVQAAFVEKSEASRARYLAQLPKAKLYFDFADFRLVSFRVLNAHLNGGFGKAYRLTAADLAS